MGEKILGLLTAYANETLNEADAEIETNPESSKEKLARWKGMVELISVLIDSNLVDNDPNGNIAIRGKVRNVICGGPDGVVITSMLDHALSMGLADQVVVGVPEPGYEAKCQGMVMKKEFMFTPPEPGTKKTYQGIIEPGFNEGVICGAEFASPGVMIKKKLEQKRKEDTKNFLKKHDK